MLPLVVLLSGVAFGANPEMYYEFPYYAWDERSVCLESGLRVVLRVDHTMPTVALTTVVGAGSAQDPPGKEGLAHVAEHLWFRADAPDGSAVKDFIEVRGGFENALTTPDVTVFKTLLSSRYLGDALDLEAGRLADPLSGIDAAELDVEREVVRNEMRQRRHGSLGGGVLADDFYGRLFPADHPYARLGLDHHESLDAIRLDDLRGFVARHYQPEAVTLLVHGDLDVDAVVDEITSRFPGVRLAEDDAHCAQRDNVATRQVPSPPDLSLAEVEASVAEPTLVLAWALPGDTGREQVLLEVVASEVQFALGADEQLKDRVVCHAAPQALASILSCAIQLGPEDTPADVRSTALYALGRLWAGHSELGQETGLARMLLIARITDGWDLGAGAVFVPADGIAADGAPRITEQIAIEVAESDLPHETTPCTQILDESGKAVVKVDGDSGAGSGPCFFAP
jgi:zinc protease